ncbi:MAG TPA: AAA family ATPase [Gaiellaceae bacterium]|nr:AAA family ATPase [Gaiellaceae bacterium]
MPGGGPVGRNRELARVDEFLAAAREDVRALAVTGPAGIGKTAVWSEAVRRAAEAGFTVLSARPGGSEIKLSFAALADLLAPVESTTLAILPAPQRRALDGALLREEVGDEPLDARAVAAAVLSVVQELAASAPVLLAVDDAQWLDPASEAGLEFAVRRLEALPVGVLVSVRVEDRREETFEQALAPDRREELELGGLGVAALHGLFKERLGHAFPRPVLVRIASAVAGNPFYALEIARELERTGVPAPGAPLPVPREMQELARARLRRLPAETLEALLAAAALSRPDLSVLDVEALAPAEHAGLVVVADDGKVRFAHPLIASAVYESASSADRRRLHRSLAEGLVDEEERARHLALASTEPDEDTALALDRAARLVANRGAVAAAVELNGLAVRLTPPEDVEALARRRHEYSQRLYFAGDVSAARRELEALVAMLPAGEPRAEALLDLGSVSWSQGDADAGIALLAQALEEAGAVALQARVHSRISLLAEDCDLGLEHAEAALALIDEESDPLLYSFALHNLARWKLYAVGEADHDAIERGMRLQQEAAAWEVSAVPAYWARDFDDFGTARTRFEDLLRVFRERGDEARGCAALAHLAVIEAMTGRLDRARRLAAEARTLAEQTEQETWEEIALWAHGQVSTQAGELEETRVAADEILRRLEDRPDAIVERMTRDMLGVAAVAGGDFEEADRQLTCAAAIDDALHVREPAAERFHADQVEAVIGLGDLERAEGLVVALESRAARIPRPWISAVSDRSRGLLLSAQGDLDGALAAFERALEHHRRLEMPVERARTLLALGQLLRRRKERRRARAVFEEALAELERVGARGWAERARAELARVPVRRAPADLTPTEDTIAQLAAGGMTNRAIAERIYVSPKTVESNLARVYRKLGIRSRAELGRAMAERERAAET